MLSKKINSIIILSFFVSLLMIQNNSVASNYSAGFSLGYNNGFGFQASGYLSNFAQDFPLKLRLSIGYTLTSNPGSSPDARRIFINNATNGTPEKQGWFWDYKFDFMYRVNWLSLRQLYLYGGPRYESFTGNFKYIGGNEDFDVITSQWGIGTGLQGFFSMSPTLDFTLSVGADYFFSNMLKGHDTEYYPDNENVNPREDYNYNDADKAINQPDLLLNFMIGINYKF
jgi:hypothetical protein